MKVLGSAVKCSTTDLCPPKQFEWLRAPSNHDVKVKLELFYFVIVWDIVACDVNETPDSPHYLDFTTETQGVRYSYIYSPYFSTSGSPLSLSCWQC